MSKLIQKRPTTLQSAFGVDKSGRNGLSVFAREWLSVSTEKFGRFMGFGNYSDSTGGYAWAAALGLALYGGAQIYEYKSLNQRPDISDDTTISVFDDSEVSLATFYEYRNNNVNNFGNINGEVNYLALRNADGSFTAYACGAGGFTSCELMTPHDVTELRTVFHQWAQEHETTYLDPDFMFPRKISAVSVEVLQQEVSDNWFGADDDFYIASDRAFRVVENAFSKNSDNMFMRLGEYDTDIQADVTELWRATLDAPQNGTYHYSDNSDLEIWPRVEGEEWDDAILGENAALNIAAVYGLLYLLTLARTAGQAAHSARRQTERIKGLDLLR